MRKPQKHTQSKIAYWSVHINKWKVSGLSQTEYCAKQKISMPAFWRWKRILSQLETVEPIDTATLPQRLIPVTLVPEASMASIPSGHQHSDAGLRLYVRDTYAIDLAVGFHADTLQTLLTTLGQT